MLQWILGRNQEPMVNGGGVYFLLITICKIWIPPGFAHGFYVLSEYADVIYRCTDYYAPDDEYVLARNSAEFAIDWPLQNETPILSARDANATVSA